MLFHFCQFPDTVEFCEEMANLGKTIIVAALDATFQRKVGVCFVNEWQKCERQLVNYSLFRFTNSHCLSRQSATVGVS